LGRKNALAILAFVFVLSALPPAFAAEFNISACTNMNTANSAYYVNSTVNSGSTFCMQIYANNVTLDCQGNTIQGTGSNPIYGIYIDGKNATVKNCALSNASSGIAITSNAINGTVDNVTIFGAGDTGIIITAPSVYRISNTNMNYVTYTGISTYSNGNSFINITLQNMTRQGLGLYSGSANNYFENVANCLGCSNSNNKYTSTVAQNISSRGNTGWWPPVLSNGSSNSNTYYGGTAGTGKNSDGSPNASLMYWYGNQGLPLASNFSGLTTDFAAVADLSNVTGLVLDKPGTGSISFPGNHGVNANGQAYDTAVAILPGIVSVNTSILDPSFNSSATLAMNGSSILNTTKVPIIVYYANFTTNRSEILEYGSDCVALGKCSNLVWNPYSKSLSFRVQGFSGYTLTDGNGTAIAYESTGTLGVNITSTNQIAVYTSNGANDSTFSFVPVTPPAAGSITLMSNQSSNTTGGELGFIVENQGNVNVSLAVSSDKGAASFVGGSSPLFQMFGGVDEAGACPSLNESMQGLSASAITICPSLGYADSHDTIWAYVLVKIDSDSPPQANTATLTFTSTAA